LNELLAARALMGLSEACYIPAALALIAAHHTGATRSLATGLHQSGIYAGIVLGGFGGGWMGERYGWRFPFTLLGVAGLAYCGALVFLREAEDGREAEERGSFAGAAARLLRDRAYLALLGVFAATSVANWLIFTWMPVYLYERFGMSLAGAGFAATFYPQFASFLGIVAGGLLADRWSRADPRGRVWTLALGLVAAAPFLMLTGVAGTPAVLLLGLAVFGFARGMYDCNWMPVLCQVAPPALRSTGYGMFNMAGTFAGGVTAAVAGGLKEALGLGVMLQAAGLILLLSALLLARLRLKPEGAADGI
jgi:predicted MFS family arabinose efflux permease